MKKATVLMTVLSLLLTITLFGCNVSYQGEPEVTTSAATSASSDVSGSDTSGESDFFALDPETTVGAGINLNRLTTASPEQGDEDGAGSGNTKVSADTPEGTTASSGSKDTSAASGSKSTTSVAPGSKSTTSSSGTKTTTGSSVKPTQSVTDPKKTETEIMESGKYVINGRMTANGETIPYRIAKDGESYALITEQEDAPIGIILTPEKMMLVNSAQKNYCTIPEDIRETMESELMTDVTQEDRTQTGTGKKEVDGVTLDYIEYSDGSTDYYYGDALVKCETVDENGNESTLYIDDVSGNVPASYFNAPAGYTEAQPNEFMSFYAALMTTTAPAQ